MWFMMGSANMTNHNPGSSYEDVFFAKLNASGSVMWAR